MLSVVITAWNEEKNIVRAISSVKSIADEIVVVDTESTDNTISIAKKLGAKVYHHKNTGIVEPVRNFSIGKAKGDWILLLDADEEIPQSLAQEIKKVVKNPQADYFRIPRKNIIFGHWIRSSHWWPDYVYRLFKKGHVTWDESIHSVPFTRGTGRDLPATEDLAIIHHNYSSVSQFIDRLNRYTDRQASELLARGYSFSAGDIVSKPAQEFLRQYFDREGYRESLHGLALSGLLAFSEMILYLKLWQNRDFVSSEVPVFQVSRLLTDAARQYQWWTYEAIIRRSHILLRPFVKLARFFKL